MKKLVFVKNVNKARAFFNKRDVQFIEDKQGIMDKADFLVLSLWVSHFIINTTTVYFSFFCVEKKNEL